MVFPGATTPISLSSNSAHTTQYNDHLRELYTRAKLGNDPLAPAHSRALIGPLCTPRDALRARALRRALNDHALPLRSDHVLT